jgi:regulator of extracellular matrix RemA (YlzA/DUF370 family)
MLRDDQTMLAQVSVTIRDDRSVILRACQCEHLCHRVILKERRSFKNN